MRERGRGRRGNDVSIASVGTSRSERRHVITGGTIRSLLLLGPWPGSGAWINTPSVSMPLGRWLAFIVVVTDRQADWGDTINCILEKNTAARMQDSECINGIDLGFIGQSFINSKSILSRRIIHELSSLSYRLIFTNIII